MFSRICYFLLPIYISEQSMITISYIKLNDHYRDSLIFTLGNSLKISRGPATRLRRVEVVKCAPGATNDVIGCPGFSNFVIYVPEYLFVYDS